MSPLTGSVWISQGAIFEIALSTVILLFLEAREAASEIAATLITSLQEENENTDDQASYFPRVWTRLASMISKIYLYKRHNVTQKSTLLVND